MVDPDFSPPPPFPGNMLSNHLERLESAILALVRLSIGAVELGSEASLLEDQIAAAQARRSEIFSYIVDNYREKSDYEKGKSVGILACMRGEQLREFPGESEQWNLGYQQGFIARREYVDPLADYFKTQHEKQAPEQTKAVDR